MSIIHQIYNSFYGLTSIPRFGIDKKQFISDINILDTKGQEIVFALCKYYASLNKLKFVDLYSQNKNDYTFFLSKFPDDLIILLQNFIYVHKKSIEEDKLRGVD